MNKIKHLCLFGVLFLSTYFTTSAQNTPCTHPDYDALVALYNATNGANWTQKWDLTDCDVCTWFGIGCDPLTNRVDEILLPDNNLMGALPSEIGEMSYLIRLELPNNQLSGTIPTEIENITPGLGFITGLRFLALQNNQLSGPIPAAIGNLSGGSILNLSNNNFEGAIPDNFADFGKDAGLTILRINVDNNQLSGCFPSNLDKFCPGDAFVSFSAMGNTGLSNAGDFAPFCASNEGICTATEPIDCEALQFIGVTERITVAGLTSSSKVEIIGSNTNYQVITICDGDCAETQIIPDLEAGEYAIKVNFFSNEGKYCYREESVIVDGDDNTDNGKANCDNLVFIGEEGQLTIEGLSANYNKVEIIGHNTDWQVIPICDGDCETTQIIPDLEAGEYTIKINQSGNDGSYCYREEEVIVTGDINNNGTANCDSLIFESGDGTITVSSLTASYNKIEILGRNTDWKVVTICDGDCLDTQIIPDLVDGKYAIKVNQSGDDGSYCYREEDVLIEHSSDSRNRGIEFGDGFILFPNPAQDRVYLQFPSLVGKTGTIQIYNAFGQVVQNLSVVSFDEDVFGIDLDGYENGIYLLTIQVENLPIISRRFVVEHLR